MSIRRLIASGLILSLVAACAPPEPAETVRLDVPDSLECLQDYSYVLDEDPRPAVEAMHVAGDRGDPLALLCRLSFNVNRGRDYTEFELLYRYFRATGMVPERLDKQVRAMDRDAVSLYISMTHRYSPGLAELEYDFWGCLQYDAMATDLLLRALPGGDMGCLPRRFLGGRAVPSWPL